MQNLTLENLTSLATIAEAVVVSFSLVFIVFEVRETRKLTQATNTQSLVELSSPLNLELILNRELAELWAYGSHQFEGMDSIDRHRYRHLLVWWLILHENIYYQRKEGLIKERVYKAWDRDLEKFVAEQKLWRFWNTLKITYESEFVNHVDEFVAKYQNLDKNA